MSRKVKFRTEEARSLIHEAFVDDTGEEPSPVEILEDENGVTYIGPMGNEQYITNLELALAQSRVETGAALLDKHMPDWERILQLDMLAVGSCHVCVCGQLARAAKKIVNGEVEAVEWDTWRGAFDFLQEQEGCDENDEPIEAAPYGFVSSYADDGTFVDYPALEVAWHRLVTARLASVVA